jgi:serpin B
MGIDLYRQVAGLPGNLLISPYSVWTAVSMLHPGARGATRDALSRVLGIDDVAAVGVVTGELEKRKQPTKYQANLIEDGYGRAESFGFHLDIANKLWVQNGYRIHADYGNTLARAFGVDPAPVDFVGAPVAACDAINRWVNDQTRGRIADIVSPQVITPLLRAILANAIYFKAGWDEEFSIGVTRPAPFKKLDGTTSTVAMMRRLHHRRCITDGGTDVVELLYIQPDVSMIVIAPKAGAFADFEKKLSHASVDKLLGKLAGKQVDLRIPKFEFSSSMSIARPLGELGLDILFSSRADLSGVSDEPGFQVGDVFHKTFIKVDEKGTEAAAVTAIAVCGAGMPPKPVEIVIDRPFYVLIRDNPTGTLLFFGRVVEPTAT